MVNVIYVFSFFSSLGFALLYNLRGRILFWTALGGALGKLAFDLNVIAGEAFDFFIASVVLAIYAEVMARLTKVPVMVYLIVGVLPIVPGAGVYRAIENFIAGNISVSMGYATDSLVACGCIALAFVLVSSTVRIFKLRRLPLLKQHLKSDIRPKMR